MKRKQKDSNMKSVKRMRSETASESVLSLCNDNSIPQSDGMKLRKTGAALNTAGTDASPTVEPLNNLTTIENRLSLSCHRTKQALHTALPDRLECRENESEAVTSFLNYHVTSRQSGSLYISGAPGSGKTAVVTKAVESLKNNRNCLTVYINCMTVRTSTAIFDLILANMIGKSEPPSSSKDACRHIEEYLTSSPSTVVLVLDEMDSLDSKNQSVLYTVFEWPSLPRSSLVLIGVANSLDLTQRILPRLQGRPDCQPKQLIFSSYLKNEIAKVLTERLTKIEGDLIFDPKAIEFCSVKVASMAGDIRMALDVCRRAVEVFETEVRRHQRSSSKENSGTNPDLTARKIGIPLVQRIVSQVYGPRVKIPSADDEKVTFPVQQELIICTLLLMLRNKQTKEINFGKFHEHFCTICPKHGIKIIEQSEFHSLCSLIESRGIISLKKAKDTRNIKVTLKVDEAELESVLKNKTLMSAVLQNGLAR